MASFPSRADPGFNEIAWQGERVRIEYTRVGSRDASAPLVVFLHEGLGCVTMWRDFPARLCEACGTRGLVFSRPGYGRSTRPAADVRDVDYLHRQAYEVLPAVLDALGVGAEPRPPWLLGHSDGGTIALLHAARFPARTAGVVAVAPHLFVEDVTVAGVGRAREAHAAGDVGARLARHHDDPEWVFRSWTDIWLDPRFRTWNIEGEVAAVRCPVLAVQGIDDEYGTLEQVRSIARAAPDVEVVELAHAGHAPQRDQPEALIAAAARFLAAHTAG